MIYWLKTGKAIEDIETFRTMDLPLEIDSLDYSGNDNDGTATNIIYSNTPDMRVYLPLTADVLDDSDFGNDGTATAITYGADGAIFNGTTSKIVTDLVITNITGWNIDFEFKHSSTLPAVIHEIFSLYQDGSYSIGVALDSSGYLIFHKRTTTYTSYAYKSLNLCDGVNHKVSINFIDSTHIQITVDNSADTVKTLSSPIDTYSTPIMAIGDSAAGTHYYYNGTLKNFRIFNRNLTTAEITQLYTYNTFTALSKAVAVFNGATSKILLTSSPVSNLTGKNITLKFKRNGLPSAAETLWNIRADANNRAYVYISSSTGRIAFEGAYAGLWWNYSSTTNLCDGNFHTIILNIIDSTHAQFIIDNVAVSIGTLANPIGEYTSPVLMLGAKISAEFFNGCLGDFYIFNRNLTTAEAAWIYEHNLDDEFYDKLDDIVDVYRQDFVRPAFYDMYLVNSNMKILRTV